MKESTVKKILAQVAFWSLSFVVLFRIFTKDYNNGAVDIIYTSLFHIPLMIAVLINSKLVRLFILNKKYIAYAIRSS